MPPRPSRPLWSLRSLQTPCQLHSRPIGRRYIQLNSVPFSPALDPTEPPTTPATTPDAKFEVLGSPSSLLSVQLSASQELYTRRGTLAAVSGKAENAVSTLSMLEPFRRAPLGVPFIYQRISSASPITALISSKSAASSFTVVHLDGRLDWIVAQRQGLLAWTGHALRVKPKINTEMSLAHWGQSYVTGRGLIGLVGRGQIYQVELKKDEEYVVHPSHVLAYAVNETFPSPYRFKSNVLRFQIPSINLGFLVPNTKFFNEVAQSKTWKYLSQAAFTIRTWARRSIFGDRLFIKFQGPTTILLQSRGSSLRDVLSNRDVNEIADSQAGSVETAKKAELRQGAESQTENTANIAAQKSSETGEVQFVNVARDGKVDFEKSEKSS